MKKIILSIFLFSLIQINAIAQENGIVVSAEWARPVIVAGRPGGAYFHVQNNGSEDDKLVSVTSSVASRVEIHEHTMTDGVMKMSQVMGVDVPAGGSIQFKPGGYHIMLFDTDKKYGPGDKIDLTLEFEKAGAIEKMVGVFAKQPE